MDKKTLSLAAPPACRTHLCSCAYFVISRMRKMCMRMREILHTKHLQGQLTLKKESSACPESDYAGLFY